MQFKLPVEDGSPASDASGTEEHGEEVLRFSEAAAKFRRLQRVGER